MPEIAASLLSADFSCLETQLKTLIQKKINYLHIDVMDGNFVPSISFGFPVIETLRKAFPGTFDVHLMIQEPIRYISRFAECGSDIITVHSEACSDIAETLKEIRKNGCRAGLSVKPSTDIRTIYPYLDLTDMILIMTVEPGFGGQTYLQDMNEKIRLCRDHINLYAPGVLIEVDGGINSGTIPEAVQAGADILVTGSAVFKGNIADNIDTFNLKIENTSKEL